MDGAMQDGAAIRTIAASLGSAHRDWSRFNTDGAILPGHPFFKVPLDLSLLEQRVNQGTFFMLHGSLGSGKSTTGYHLLKHLRVKYGWLGVAVHLKPVSVDTAEAFWRNLSRQLVRDTKGRSIEFAPFVNGEGFMSSFLSSVLGGKRVVLMIDDLDVLNSAAAGVKEEFFGALRAITRNRQDYAIQSIVALGRPSILYMDDGSPGSLFTAADAVPAKPFTRDQVAHLLQQYADATCTVTVEDGVADDIHEYTAGHPLMVGACCREIELHSEMRRQHQVVRLAAWREYRAQDMTRRAIDWRQIARSGTLAERMPPQPLAQLKLALLVGDEPIRAEDEASLAAARHAVSEGWLVPTGDDGTRFTVASPVVRNTALLELADTTRSWVPRNPPPLDGSGALDMPAVVAALLERFSTGAMVTAASLASKHSGTSALDPESILSNAPDQAAYHFQLFTTLRQWLAVWSHADVYPEADVDRQETKQQFADILVMGRRVRNAPKHIVAVAASTKDPDVQQRYIRAIEYMKASNTNVGTCITFTAVDSAVTVANTGADLLAWPSEAQLATGVVAIHVVHDLAWTTAVVLSLKQGEEVKSQRVNLRAGSA